MDWRDIPSLAALRAFEATARLSSFSAAARELNVTHAAIAQHVRGLEAEFGCELVFRQGAGMALTDAGRALALSLGEGFATEDARRFLRLGYVDRYDVRATHHLVEIDALDFEARGGFGREIGIVHDHLHAEALGAGDDMTTDTRKGER